MLLRGGEAAQPVFAAPERGTMTAERASKAALGGIWETLRSAKEQWVLLVFLAGTLLWARDTYQEFAGLPELVRRQMDGLATLEATVTRLEVELKRRFEGDREPVFGFPGTGHSIDDGAAGAWTVLRWRPVRRLRADCLPVAIDAFMVDVAGQWFSVESAMTPMPALDGDADVAFGIRIPAAVHPGRARVGVQITSDCGSHMQVDPAPWLQFRVSGG